MNKMNEMNEISEITELNKNEYRRKREKQGRIIFNKNGPVLPFLKLNLKLEQMLNNVDCHMKVVGDGAYLCVAGDSARLGACTINTCNNILLLYYPNSVL